MEVEVVETPHVALLLTLLGDDELEHIVARQHHPIDLTRAHLAEQANRLVLVFLHYARMSGVSSLKEATRLRLVGLQGEPPPPPVFFCVPPASAARAPSLRALTHPPPPFASAALARDSMLDTRDFDLNAIGRVLATHADESSRGRSAAPPRGSPPPGCSASPIKTTSTITALSRLSLPPPTRPSI